MNTNYNKLGFKDILYKKITPKILSLLTLIFLFLLVCSETIYAKMPEPTKDFYCADYASLLNQDTESSIRSVNLNYEATEEKPQVVVATVDNMDGLDIDTYAVELFEKWKIGNSKLNNGVLILLALEERKIRIEVGYGLEGAITDGTVGQILDSADSFLSDDDYNKAILQVFYDVTDKVNAEYGYDNEKIYSGSAERPAAETEPLSILEMIIYGAAILFVIIAFIYDKISGGGFDWFGGFGGGGSIGGGGRSGGGGGSRGF